MLLAKSLLACIALMLLALSFRRWRTPKAVPYPNRKLYGIRLVLLALLAPLLVTASLEAHITAEPKEPAPLLASEAFLEQRCLPYSFGFAYQPVFPHYRPLPIYVTHNLANLGVDLDREAIPTPTQLAPYEMQLRLYANPGVSSNLKLVAYHYRGETKVAESRSHTDERGGDGSWLVFRFSPKVSLHDHYFVLMKDDG